MSKIWGIWLPPTSKQSFRDRSSIEFLADPSEMMFKFGTFSTISVRTCSSYSCHITGGPSSSCEMIILHNNSHGGIIRVSIGIFTTALRNKKIHQILKKSTSPYFHSVLLVIWPLTLMKRTHFSEFSISRFSTFIRKAQGWTLHLRTSDLRSEKSQRKMTGRPQIKRRIQARIL